MELPLANEVPSPDELPHAPLGDFPTPVERKSDFGERLGVPNLHVKFDGRTGKAYGGNKVRKLEFLLADAKRRGQTDVWTGGGIGSNHVLATSIYARQLSLVPHLVHFPQPVNDHVRENLRALATTYPELYLVGSELRAGVAALRLKLRRRLARSPDFYYVPPGGSAPVGELGYVNAAFELRDQIASGALPEPDRIVLPVGTGGTIAGLLVGCRLASLDVELVGVRVANKLFGNSIRIARLANRTSSLLASYGISPPPKFTRNDVTVLDGHVGGEYGETTAKAREATELAEEFGLDLDPTFTAKTVAALRSERHRLDLADSEVLYWHTYNEVDLTDRITRADVSEDLPAEYQRFF